MKYYCGIDNGLDGGISIVDEDGGLYSNMIMPVIKKGKGREVDVMGIDALIKTLNEFNVFFLIEEASKMSPGKMSLCSTWFTYGSILAVLQINQCRFDSIHSLTWQKEFWKKPKMPKGQKYDTKAEALRVANRLWPQEDWLKSQKSTIPHDGMIDASLIAEYARRKNL